MRILFVDGTGDWAHSWHSAWSKILNTKVILNQACMNLLQLQLRLKWALLTETGLAWQSSSLLTLWQCLSIRGNWEHLVPYLVKQRAKSERKGVQQPSATMSLKCRATEPEQFPSLLYPWRPQDCRGWGLWHCCHHVPTGDRKMKLSWQGGPCRSHRSLWDSRAQAEPHHDLVEMAKHSKQFSSCTLQPSHPSDKQLSTQPGWRGHSCQCQGLSQGHLVPMTVFSLVTLVYWWHWDRWPAASGVPLLGMCYMKMVLDW